MGSGCTGQGKGRVPDEGPVAFSPFFSYAVP